MTNKPFPFLSIAVLLISGTAIFNSCSRLNSIPIRNLLENPREYEGKVMTIEGQVTDNKSLLVVKYFKIKDSTGKIVVITDRLLPQIGQTERVRGRIDQTFSIGKSSMTVLIEEPTDK